MRSEGIPKCGFVVVSPVWRRVFRVFRYHQAAANPPASAEAAAITPTLIHPEARASEDCVEEEVSDSEGLVILFAHLQTAYSDGFSFAD